MNPRLRPVLIVAALALGVGGFYSLRVFQEASQRAEERKAAIAEAESLLAADKAGDSSRVVAQLLDLGPGDQEARALCARLELQRGRPERAVELLRPTLQQDAAESTLRVAAEAWLSHSERAPGDAGARRALLVEGLGFAERAAASSGAEADWFVCWQAATRLGDADASARAAAALDSFDPDGLRARTAKMILDMQKPDSAPPSLEAVSGLSASWGKAPLELRLLECGMRIATNDLEVALRLADEAVAEAPNRFEARNLAATAHHSAAMQAEEGPGRERHVRIRDAQIDWLDANADADDSRRPTWLSWRQAR